MNAAIYSRPSAISLATRDYLKGLVHFQTKISLFTHPQVIQDVYVFLSSVENKLSFDENIPGFISI